MVFFQVEFLHHDIAKMFWITTGGWALNLLESGFHNFLVFHRRRLPHVYMHLHKSKTWKYFVWVVESFLLCGLVSNIEKHFKKMPQHNIFWNLILEMPYTNFFLHKCVTQFLEKIYFLKNVSPLHLLKLSPPGHLLSTPSDVPSTVIGYDCKEMLSILY